MKKTLLITLDFPPNVGGVATYYSNICKELPAENLIVLAPKHQDSDEFDDNQKYKISRQALISKNPFLWPRWWPALKIVKKIIEEEKIEIILAGQILPVGTMALYFNYAKKTPYYIFSHGMDITKLSGRKKMLAKKIIRHAAGMFVNSNFTKQQAIKLDALADETTVVYPCPHIHQRPTSGEIEATKLQFGLENKKVILTVGRLIKRKGCDMVIEAMPAVLQKIPNTIYIIAGAGPEADNLKTLVRTKRIADNVIFTNGVSDKKLSALFELCDVFIMPARQLPDGDVEGFGIVYLEAALFGKPVIGGKSGGVPEAVIDGYTGLVVDPLNTSQIAAAIIKLLTDESLAQSLGLQGQQRVLEKFDWGKEAGKVEKLLVSS